MLSPFFRLLHRVNINEQHRVAQQNANTAQTSQRRTSALGEQYREDCWEENTELVRENAQLKAANDRAMALIRRLADRSETFQRIAAHLRQAWAQGSTDCGPVPASVDQPDQQYDATHAQLNADAEWLARREARIRSLLSPAYPPKNTR